MLCQAYRAGGRRAWALPVAVTVEVVWVIFVWSSFTDFLPWALWLTVAAGVVAIAALASARLPGPTRARLAMAGVVAGVVAMLAAPATWAASVLNINYGGSAFNASAGPAGVMNWSGGGTGSGGTMSRGNLAGVRMGATTTLTTGQQQIYDYTQAHRDGAGYLMAVSSWASASPYILATGQEVLSMGGFSAAVPEPSLTHVRELVHSGQLRFFLLHTAGIGWGIPSSGETATTIMNWVEKTCGAVPSQNYGGDGGSGTLYQCP
jgi:hypothetical protein